MAGSGSGSLTSPRERLRQFGHSVGVVEARPVWDVAGERADARPCQLCNGLMWRVMALHGMEHVIPCTCVKPCAADYIEKPESPFQRIVRERREGGR